MSWCSVDAVHPDVSVLGIDATVDINDLALLILNHITLNSEELPPSGVGNFESEVAAAASGLDGETVALVAWVVTQDCLLLLVENKLLSLIISVVVLDDEVCTVGSENSVHWKHVDD